MMDTNKLVSVIVPAYNMCAYLPFALQSILDQSYPHFEIHVVDDGSKDATREVMDRFLKDIRVHYHYQENRGLSGARNTGIRASRGEVIALCDADDMWTPNKLELQMACLESASNAGVVYTNVSMVDIHGQRLWTYQEPRYSGKITDRLFISNFVTGCSALIRRNCLERAGLYNETLTTGEDYDLWLRISTCCEFLYLDEITYLYRQWEGQMSRNEPLMNENAIQIKKAFLDKYAVFVSPQAVSQAWAASYVSRGLCTMKWKKSRLGAIRDILRALRHKPGYLPAWKAAVKILINQI